MLRESCDDSSQGSSHWKISTRSGASTGGGGGGRGTASEFASFSCNASLVHASQDSDKDDFLTLEVDLEWEERMVARKKAYIRTSKVEAEL